MARRYLVLLCPLLISACALPVPVQIASWTLDGLSFLMTKKSISDHGISMVMGEDCALYREFTEGDVCRVNASDDGTLVADAGTEPSDAAPLVGNGAIDELASFETAAGPTEATDLPPAIEIASTGADLPFVDDWNSTSSPVATSVQISEAPALPLGPRAPEIQAKPVAAKTALAKSADGILAAGLYFSLGSFRSEANAQKLATLCPDLGPLVMPVDLDGRTFYRVVVGPVRAEHKPGVFDQIKAAGFYDAWPFSWSVAGSPSQPG